MKCDQIEMAKERVKEANMALAEARKIRIQKWREEFVNNFLHKNISFGIKDTQQKKKQAKKVMEKAFETICKLIPDDEERKEFLSSYGN